MYGVVLQNLAILRQAVPVLFDQVVFYKMASYCRPKVAGDLISGQRAFGVEVVPLTKFGDPSSNRLATIQNAADRQTDGQTDMLARKAHLMHCVLHACTASVG